MDLPTDVVEKLSNLGAGFPAKADFQLGEYLTRLGLSGLRTHTLLSEDFLASDFPGNEFWTAIGTGVVGTVTTTASLLLGAAAGVLALQTAAANQFAISRQSPVAIPLGFGATSIEIRSRLMSLVPDGVNNFTVRFGLGNQVTGAAPTRGLSFLFDTTISPNWITEEIFLGLTVQKISSVVAVPSVWGRFRIEVNAAGTAAEFYINDVLVNTHNLVAVLNEETLRYGPTMQMLKTLGAATRQHYIDYVWLSKEITRT